MGVSTKIDWCDSTWNPVTGCLHGCEYSGRPIFMKESLRGLMGDDFIQQFPWDNAKKERNK